MILPSLDPESLERDSKYHGKFDSKHATLAGKEQTMSQPHGNEAPGSQGYLSPPGTSYSLSWSRRNPYHHAFNCTNPLDDQLFIELRTLRNLVLKQSENTKIQFDALHHELGRQRAITRRVYREVQMLERAGDGNAVQQRILGVLEDQASNLRDIRDATCRLDEEY